MHACGHDIHTAVLMGVLQELNRSRDFEGTLLRALPAGRGVQPRRRVAGAGRRAFRRLRRAGRGRRACRTVARSGHLRIPRGQIHGFERRTALHRTRHRGARRTAQSIARPRSRRRRARRRTAGPQPAGARPLDRPHRGRRRDERRPRRRPARRTLRTFDEALRCASYDAIREIAASADRRYGVRTAVDIRRGYPCVVNDPALASLARSLAAERMAAVDLSLRTTAEDFGFYTHHISFAVLPAGRRRGVRKPHTSTFSPDEKAITRA